jgi:nucleoside-diphosphate-sugar epimerase
MDEIILLTGSTGFIGKNLLQKLNPKSVFLITRESFVGDMKIFDVNMNSFSPSKLENKVIIFVHLATYFSKLDEHKNLILEANINLAKNILYSLSGFQIKKFIYMNTMYKFYSDENIRELFYTKTKQECSNILSEYSIKNDIFYEEIFLDNTVGVRDFRNKVIPIICNSIQSNKENPIENLENYINLISVNDVVLRLLHAINTNERGSSIFINFKSINLNSIYEFLKYYKDNNVINNKILKYKDNNFVSNNLKINHKGIKLSDVSLELIKIVDYEVK